MLFSGACRDRPPRETRMNGAGLGGAFRIAAAALTALVALWGAAAIWIDGPAEPIPRRPARGGFPGLRWPWRSPGCDRPSARACGPSSPARRFCAGGSRSGRATTATGSPTSRARPPPSGRAARHRARRARLRLPHARPTSPSAGRRAATTSTACVGLDLFVSLLGAHALRPHDPELGVRGLPAARGSIETRKEKGESYSAAARVLPAVRARLRAGRRARRRSRLRTDYRGERVFLYRLATSPRGRARSARAVPGGGQRARPPSRPGTTRSPRTARRRIWRNVQGHVAREPRSTGGCSRTATSTELAYERGLGGHEPALRRAAAAQRRHGAREGLRLPGRLLPLHPGGPAHSAGATAVDCRVGTGSERRARG